jgi:predicted cytidylate kinase
VPRLRGGGSSSRRGAFACDRASARGPGVPPIDVYNDRVLITISGLPGSGKTTVARLVAKALGLEHVYAGDIFRRQAEAHGMSLQEYVRRAETNHSIDRALDEQMRRRAAQGNAVLEGRLAAFMAEEAGVSALRVFLDADEGVRAARIAGREGGDAAARQRETQVREASDARRYQEIYGVDYHDRSKYDLVLATDGRTPEDLASEIVGHARR